MLIYSPSRKQKMSSQQHVPNRAEEEDRFISASATIRSEHEATGERHREEMSLPRLEASSSSASDGRRRINCRLVTETILLSVSLLVGIIFGGRPSPLVECNQLQRQQQPSRLQLWPRNLSSAENPPAWPADRSSGGGSGASSFGFGRTAGQMLASLGPRREPSAPAMQASSLSFDLWEPAASWPLLSSEAHRSPPVYRSAPKQIIEVHQEERPKRQPIATAVEMTVAKRPAPSPAPKDLHSAAAAGHKRRRHYKKPKTHAYPAHYTYLGKYHEHRSVPSKGAWEFGYKRGNSKHTIEREEHGHKSHFKTEVKWKDKKGKGHHVFDYNHGDHDKKYHAAASQVTQKKSQPAKKATQTERKKKKNESA